MGRGLVAVLPLCRDTPGLHQPGYKLLFARQVPSSITLLGKSHLLEGVFTLKLISSQDWLKAPPHTHTQTPTYPNHSSTSFSIHLTPFLCSLLKSNRSSQLPRFSINFRSSPSQRRLPVFKTHPAGRRADRIHTGQLGAFSAHMQVLPLRSLLHPNPYCQS